MIDETAPLDECRHELAVVQGIASDLRRQLDAIEIEIEQFDHARPGEDPVDAVRRLMALVYNADDGSSRLLLDPVEARVVGLLEAVETAWMATHIPGGQSPTEYLWKAVRTYMGG